jgi:hypothetical protein
MEQKGKKFFYYATGEATTIVEKSMRNNSRCIDIAKHINQYSFSLPTTHNNS